VFKVVTPDNMAVVVDKADPIEPRRSQAFVEYAQSRGLLVDRYVSLLMGEVARLTDELMGTDLLAAATPPMSMCRWRSGAPLPTCVGPPTSRVADPRWAGDPLGRTALFGVVVTSSGAEPRHPQPAGRRA
jgi:hypothetical protein